MTGKDKCKLLREIRKEIAKANNIVYLTADCNNSADCLGTCPKCDAEIRYLESELNRLSDEGKNISLRNMEVTNLETIINSIVDSNSNNEIDLNVIEETVDLDMPIEDLDLSVRTYNALRRGGIKTLNDLLNLTEEGIMRIRNLGRRNVEEIQQKLNELGFTFPCSNECDEDIERNRPLLGQIMDSSPFPSRSIEEIEADLKRVGLYGADTDT